MTRPWQIWLVFAAASLVVIGAVGWLSYRALKADAAEVAAQQQAALEEAARLALWRMDSLMTPLVAQESARPYFTYAAFYSAERAYGRMFNTRGKGEPDVSIPSPLLAQQTPYVRLHFQLDSGNTLTSPEFPVGKYRTEAVPALLSDEQYADNGKILQSVEQSLNLTTLLAQLPPPEPATATPAFDPANQLRLAQSPNAFATPPNSNAFGNAVANPPAENAPPVQTQQQQGALPQDANSFNNQLAAGKQSAEQQGSRGQLEYQARQRSFSQTNTAAQNLGQNYTSAPNFNLNSDANPPGTQPPDVQMSMMTPLWSGDDLILTRRVCIGPREFVQGCLLDWPAIRERLRAEVNDLLPEADVVADASADPSLSVRRLASLPVKLIPGALPPVAAAGLSPIKQSLLVAWGAMSLAAVAVAVLLGGVMALSERRAALVSAVTHELRTPLTTFRMYAEMLSTGMVREESDRHRYLETLRAEADRLTHLVANVLAYARLERGRPGGRLETVTVERLLDVATQRLADRVAQADLKLSVESSDGVLQRQVKTDPAAVEQILFNLVDNACKYAVETTDRTLHLSAGADGTNVCLRLRDHGPGVSALEQRRLFQPFRKSARDAAHSAPGVGLGLALSRRLARDMGGDLRCEPCDGGACFVLSLPAKA